MSRDKQIEEMHLEFEKWDDADTKLSLSEWLYNAGYRKASDVAEEIFAEIINLLMSFIYLGADGQWHTTKKYASKLHSFVEGCIELKKKYTEEGK